MLEPAFLVAVTDEGWFRYLRQRPDLDEANFWRPSGQVWHLPLGTPLIFKTRFPAHQIVGVGFCGFQRRMTVRDSWEFFGDKNGAPNLTVLRQRIGKHLPARIANEDHTIGCIIVLEPKFFTDDMAFDAPVAWRKNTPGFKSSVLDPEGKIVWEQIQARFSTAFTPGISTLTPFGGLGAPGAHRPRLGQGAFRSLVLSAYGNQCAVTREHSLPVLEAAHIVDFASREEHEISNGISLRADVHKLFDRGYVSIRPDHRFVVSKSLRDDFNNGKVYYQYHEQEIILPEHPLLRPKLEHLEKHYAERFRH